MNWYLLPLAFLLLLLSLPTALSAQKLDPATAGRTYVIAFPDTVRNRIDLRRPNPSHDTILVLIFSAVTTNVHITGRGYSNHIVVQGGTFSRVYLNASTSTAERPIFDLFGIASSDVFRLEADAPVVIYCYVATDFGGEAWTPVPVDRWGVDYYASAFPGEVLQDVFPVSPNEFVEQQKMAPAVITIVSAYDNTNVTIVPTSKTVWHNFPPMTVKMMANQAYQIASFVDTIPSHSGETQPDIGGVSITSDRPIGVISGNTRAALTQNASPTITRNSARNMMIEWLAPTDQHGTEFVYLPTWDSRRRTGLPGEKVEEKRPAERVRVYNSVQIPGNATVAGSGLSAGVMTTFTIRNQGFYEDTISEPVAHLYRTDTAAQAFMGSMPAVQYAGTDVDPIVYNTWGGYMVEMTPREQWPRFAPYCAPMHPGGMEHFVNIVTDTASRLKIFKENGTRMVFTMPIEGTDLIWGTMAVTPGVDHYFEGRDSARFYAYAYGLRKGRERFEVSGGTDPGFYEEEIAVAYGYPLAPRRNALRGQGASGVKDRSGEGMLSLAVSPNPSSTRTTLSFTLAAPAKTTVTIVNTIGERVATLADDILHAGEHQFIWDSHGQAPGIYYCRVTSGSRSDLRPVVVVR